MDLNLDHKSVSDSRVLTNTIPHEALHNAGTYDIDMGNGLKRIVTAEIQRSGYFDSLPMTHPEDVLRNTDTVRAFQNSLE